MVRVYIFPLINTPTPRGVIISQPIFGFLGVVFDVDHDFEGPRSPKAHLDTVLRNLSIHLGTPRTTTAQDAGQDGHTVAWLIWQPDAALSKERPLDRDGSRSLASFLGLYLYKNRPLAK